MGYPVAYLSGNTTTYETGMFKRGTIGQNQAATLTGNYRWWNGIDVTSSQYLIYSDTFTTSASTEANATPAAWSTPDLTDQSLLALINTLPERVGKLPFTYLPVALQWIQSTGRYFLLKNGYENIVTDGLKVNLDSGWYLSYSGTGTTWKDLSSNNLNGALTNGPTFSNGALTFDGSDDNVQLGNASNIITNTSEITVESWVKTNVIETYKKIFTTVGSNSQSITGIYFSIGPSPYNTYFGVKTNIAQDGATTTTNLSTTQYSHVVGTYNNPFAKLYINGSLMATLNVGGTLGTSGIARISGYDNNNESWNGQIPVFRTYTRELSQSEITQNYNAQKTRFGLTADTIVTSGLTINLDAGSVVSYPTTGTSWYDISYNNYNASLNNGITFSSLSGGTFILDGTDDYVNIPNGFTNMFKGKTHWTASIWIKVNNWGSGNDQYPVLVSIGENQGQYGELYLEIGNVGQYYFAYAGDFTAGSLTTNLNQVYNLVYMKDGSSFKVYRDGVLIDTVTGKNNVSNVDGDLWLGRFKTGDFDLNGNIYNFSMYNRALTGSEVLQNYNALKGRFGL